MPHSLNPIHELSIMKYLWIIFAIIIPAGAIIGLNQRKALRRLETTNTSLQNVAAKVTRLKEENAELSGLKVDQEELERLRKHTEELLRLRSEVSRLGAADQVDADKIKSQIKDLHAQAQTDRERAETSKAWGEALKISKERKKIGGIIANYILQCAGFNNGKYPRSFQEIPMILENANEQAAVNTWLNYANRGDLSKFEFMPVPFNASSGSGRSFPIFREKTPRQLPDGRWTRVYGFSIGGIQEIVLPENRFFEWEQEHLP